MRALLTLVLGAILFLAAAPVWAASDRRVALVIGNSAYRRFPALPNPKNDAEDVTAALKKVGFTVVGGADLTREAMRDSLRQFARAAQDAEAALVYYAGHGLQYRGRNYLVPIDAKLEDEFDLEYETVRVDDVVEELARADGARILILDACRNLPLATRGRDPFSATGLAKLSGRGLIVAYATQANQVAYDGTGRNSLFTGAFVKTVAEPGLDATQMFQRVSMNVDKATGGRQTPELSLSYPGQFFFNKSETEREAWPRARASGDPDALREFIARFPSSFLVDDARDLIARLEAGRGSNPAPRAPAVTADARAPARRPEDDTKAREEAERLAWQKLQDDQKRRADARAQAERDRAADEAKDRARLAAEAKAEEEGRRIEARRLELERQAEEGRQKKLAEERALAEGRERQRLAAEARAEEARQKKLADERSAAEARERQRLAAEARAEEDRRREEARKAERERVAEDARQKKLAEEAAAAEARERQRLALEARTEAARVERERIAAEARQKKIADDATAAEAKDRQRIAAEMRAEEETRREQARRAERERLVEDARQKKVAEEERAAGARQSFAAASSTSPVPAASAGDLSPEERDRLAWAKLEEAQRRRSLVAADPAPAAQDGTVQTTLSALKGGSGADRPGATRLALADPTAPVGPTPTPAPVGPVEALSRDKLVRDLQGELARIGCSDYEPDGEWDAETRDALRRFGRQAKLSPLPGEPTTELLDDLKNRPAQFCPLQCGSGEKQDGDRCVAVARPERPAIRPKAVAQERREPSPVRQRAPAAAPPQVAAPVAAAPRPARALMGVGF